MKERKMKKHTKIYLDYFNYGREDFIPCEVCGSKAVDIHHIEARGMGGSKQADTIENLMAVCRSCQVKYGDVPSKKQWIKKIHNRLL